MVKSIARRLSLLALAALIGAVGIGPRRETGSDPGDDSSGFDRRGNASRWFAPSPAVSAPQSRVGISPRVTAPASGFSPSAAGSVRIQRREGFVNVPRRRYSHFFDGSVYWYGYPYGAGFFWARPYGGLWWTWDVRFSRWVYWNDGFWWWLGPGGAQFVYMNDNYYPYDTVRQAPSSSPPASHPASPSGALGSWSSPDGRRLVEVSGPDAQAILYDKTHEPSAYIGFLGKDARKISFSNAAPGSPATIAVVFRNGSSAVFDYDGRRLDTAKPAAVKETPPEGDVPPAPPGDLPPPPSEDLPPPPR